MRKPALLLEIDGNWPFRTEKRQHLELQTSKLKAVKSFEKFGKNFINQDLFGYIDAFQGTEMQVYFFSAQILKEILKDLQQPRGNAKRPQNHKIWVDSFKLD